MVKNPPANAGDVGSIPGLGRSSEEGNETHSSILAGKSHEQRSLEGYSPWGRKESDITERLRAGACIRIHPHSREVFC